MDDTTSRRNSYVGRVHDDTQRILREVMSENDKLRLIAVEMQRDNGALQAQLASLTAELQRQQNEKVSLLTKLNDIEQESRRYSEQFAEVEQRSANLASLYVSSYQLHGTLDRETVLATIREIVINLIGSEELAVFEATSDGAALELVTSFGIDDSRYARISLGEDPIGRLVAGGEPYWQGREGQSKEVPGLVACLPLTVDGRLTGAIVLFSLLSHKSSLHELDFELFDLLGTHAATAMYCSSLHTKLEPGAAA